MRDDYQELTSKINDTYELTKSDAARLLVSTMIQVSQIQDQLQNFKKVVNQYESDLIPKLQKVIDAEDDEAAKIIAEANFIIENNE